MNADGERIFVSQFRFFRQLTLIGIDVSGAARRNQPADLQYAKILFSCSILLRPIDDSFMRR